MSRLAVLQATAALAGAGVAALAALRPRFGPASGFLSAFLTSSSLAALALAAGGRVDAFDEPDSLRLAFSILLLAGPGGLFFALTLSREDWRESLRRRRWILAAISIAAPVLATLLFLEGPGAEDDPSVPENHLALGPAGYASALYLLAVSVLVLASLERTLRSAEEHVRWEIKFVVVGLYAAFAALIYIASRILLYSFERCLLSRDAMRVFPVIFLFTCVLIFMSWRRGSGRSRVVVSQGVILGSVTFLGVGIYLIASSVVAQWAGTLVGRGIETEAVVFLLSVLLFSIVLLSTRFRHRVRYWIRRNFFGGRYDYRTFWMEATEAVRASDPPGTAAGALADLVCRALGTLDVTVWLRAREPGKLRLAAVRGCSAGPPPREVSGLLDGLAGLSEPISVRELNGAGGIELDERFLRSTSACLLVPLRSGGEAVGLLTVGSDRSGKSFGWETGELLRVIASHAAGEFHKAELLETQVAAKEAEAFRSFSTFLLHDLKNFASTLSLIAKNAARYQGNPEFQRDAFQSVFDTAEKMQRLCGSLRTFAGSVAAQKELGDLNRVVQDVVKTFDGTLQSRLRQDLEDVPPVLIDSEEVARVLQNLVLNAAEATSPGGSITVRTRRLAGSVELSVEDKGTGIPRSFLEKELFLPFRTTKSSGLGIGLFQSKKIVEAHGGAIRVESEEGKGTTVTATFPLPKGTGGRAAPEGGREP